MAAVETPGRTRAPPRCARGKPRRTGGRRRTPAGARRAAEPLLAPDVGRAALLADPGLIHEPQLDPRRLGVPVRHTPEQIREVFCTAPAPSGRPRGGLARSSATRGRALRAAEACRSGGSAPRTAPRPGRTGRGRARRCSRPAPSRDRAGPGPQGGLPTFVEGAWPTGPRPVAEALDPFGIVAVDPIAERLPGHAGEPCQTTSGTHPAATSKTQPPSSCR